MRRYSWNHSNCRSSALHVKNERREVHSESLRIVPSNGIQHDLYVGVNQHEPPLDIGRLETLFELAIVIDPRISAETADEADHRTALHGWKGFGGAGHDCWVPVD